MNNLVEWYSTFKEKARKPVTSEFQKAAIMERQYLDRLYAEMYDTKFIPTPDNSKIHFDGTLCKSGKQYIVEAKVRKATYEAYYLEEDKYKNLLQVSAEFGMDILYINFTPSGTYVWNLSDMKKKNQIMPFQMRWMNEKTAEHTEVKVRKSVTLLPVGNAVCYKLKVQRTKEEEQAVLSMVRALINK